MQKGRVVLAEEFVCMQKGRGRFGKSGLEGGVVSC